MRLFPRRRRRRPEEERMATTGRRQQQQRSSGRREAEEHGRRRLFRRRNRAKRARDHNRCVCFFSNFSFPVKRLSLVFSIRVGRERVFFDHRSRADTPTLTFLLSFLSLALSFFFFSGNTNTSSPGILVSILGPRTDRRIDLPSEAANGSLWVLPRRKQTQNLQRCNKRRRKKMLAQKVDGEGPSPDVIQSSTGRVVRAFHRLRWWTRAEQTRYHEREAKRTRRGEDFVGEQDPT